MKTTKKQFSERFIIKTRGDSSVGLRPTHHEIDVLCPDLDASDFENFTAFLKECFEEYFEDCSRADAKTLAEHTTKIHDDFDSY